MKISCKMYNYIEPIQQQHNYNKYILLHILAQYSISLVDALYTGTVLIARSRKDEYMSLFLRAS